MERSPNVAKNVLETALRRMGRPNLALGQAGYSARDGRLAKEILRHPTAFAELLATFQRWVTDLDGPERHDELNRWLWQTVKQPFILKVREMGRVYNLGGNPSDEPRSAA